MPPTHRGETTAGDHRFAVVVSRFNTPVTDKLLEGAIAALGEAGVHTDELEIAEVPGAMELAVVARRFAVTGDYAAVICLGCVIRGETAHYDAVVAGCTQGITSVSIETGVPCIFGVLTTETSEQAIARVDGSKKNTGAYAAQAAVQMANLMTKIG